MEGFVIFLLIGLFAIGRLVSKHPSTSGKVARGIFASIFRK
jgi:hypothetical protein